MGDYITAQDGTIIRDFIARTLRNLEFIETHAPERGEVTAPSVYEVTQLINSMLGLLVFPREEFWTYFTITSLDELPEQFPTLRQQKHRIIIARHETSEFQALVRLMRNSFAHFGVETNAHTGQIEALILTNRNPSGRVTWQMRIRIAEMRAFVDWFAHGIMDSSLLSMPIQEIKIA